MKKELTILQWVGIFFVVCIFVFFLTLKVCGSTEMPIYVEKDGYCKIVYGEEYGFDEKNEYCENQKDWKDKTKIEFTYEEFRKVCPKNKFFSSSFFNSCFNEGDSR